MYIQHNLLFYILNMVTCIMKNSSNNKKVFYLQYLFYIFLFIVYFLIVSKLLIHQLIDILVTFQSENWYIRLMHSVFSYILSDLFIQSSYLQHYFNNTSSRLPDCRSSDKNLFLKAFINISIVKTKLQKPFIIKNHVFQNVFW